MKTIKLTRAKARKDLIQGTNNKKNICETLRLIYDEIYSIEFDSGNLQALNETEKLLIDAIIMAKKMQNRLSYYQKKYKDNTGNKASSIIGLTGVNARGRMRKARAL